MLEVDTDTHSSAPDATPAAPLPRGSVRRFYGYKFATETSLLSAIWVIYLRERGYSLTEIGLSEAAFHLAPLLLEIPSGSFADLVGRRWSLALGAGLIAVSHALLWSAPSFALVAVAMFLHGASFSFRSGADQAYLYEALGDDRGQYAGIFGRLLGALYLVAAASAWIGGVLSDSGYGWPFALTIGFALGGVWLALTLAEPQRPAAALRAAGHVGMRELVREHAHDAWKLLRGNRTVTALLIFSGPFWAAGTVCHLYLQAAFSDRGLSNGMVSLVVAGGLVLTALGATLAGRFDRWRQFRWRLSGLALVIGVGFALTSVQTTVIATAAYLVANLAGGVAEPLLSNWFNRQIPSEQRATLLSIESWTFSATMIVAFPLAGQLAERAGWGALFITAGLANIALAGAVIVAARRE
jgi:MFS family permease